MHVFVVGWIMLLLSPAHNTSPAHIYHIARCLAQSLP
jgi:hypothetical protein